MWVSNATLFILAKPHDPNARPRQGAPRRSACARRRAAMSSTAFLTSRCPEHGPARAKPPGAHRSGRPAACPARNASSSAVMPASTSSGVAVVVRADVDHAQLLVRRLRMACVYQEASNAQPGRRRAGAWVETACWSGCCCCRATLACTAYRDRPVAGGISIR